MNMVPSTSEDAILRRANKLLPSSLFYPIPSFKGFKMGSFSHFYEGKKVSSVEGLREMLGSLLYDHIDNHPIREYLQTNLEEYQSTFSLNKIAQKIQELLPKTYVEAPLGKEKIQALLEAMGEMCIPDWVYARAEPDPVAMQLASAITAGNGWGAVIVATRCDYFPYEALKKYVKEARSQKPTHLGVVVDTGENITRAVLLKALSRCLGQFFIRCLLYAFRNFTTSHPDQDGNCCYSINMQLLQFYAKEISAPLNSTTTSLPAPVVSRVDPPISHGKAGMLVIKPLSGWIPLPSRSNVVSSQAEVAPERSYPMEVEPAASPSEDKPAPKPKAVSMDEAPPPAAVPLNISIGYPPSPHNPNLIQLTPDVSSSSSPQNGPSPNNSYDLPSLDQPSPANNMIFRFHTGNGSPRFVRLNTEGEPPKKRKAEDVTMAYQSWEQTADRKMDELMEEDTRLQYNLDDRTRENLKLMEMNRSLLEEKTILTEKIRELTDENIRLKELEGGVKIEGDQLKENEERMEAMKAEMEKKETDYKKEIKLLEGEIKEKQQKLNRALSTAGSNKQADIWEKEYYASQRELILKKADYYNLEEEKNDLLKAKEELHRKSQEMAEREKIQLVEIEKLKQEIEEMKEKFSEAQDRIVGLEQQWEEQNENMEKQQKQLLKHTELKRCYAEMDKEKQKVEEALVGREQLAQEVEAELKDKIANLEKELKVAKEERDVAVKEKEDGQAHQIAQLKEEKAQLLARIETLENEVKKEKKKQEASALALKRTAARWELIKKERDDLKAANGKEREEINRLVRELDQVRKDLKKTEKIFGELKHSWKRKETKIFELTERVDTLEEAKKQLEEMEKRMTAELEKKERELQEEMDNHTQEKAQWILESEKKRQEELEEKKNIFLDSMKDFENLKENICKMFTPPK